MLPLLFHYLDYRHFLKDYYAAQKKKKGTAFSFRSFARLAGLRSPNFLKLVMDGKRNLGIKGIRQFIKALHLNREEASYFENLVQFNQATHDEERSDWYQKLSQSKKYREVHEIEQDLFVYFSRWYYAAIRDLVLVPNFQEDPRWVAKHLSPPIHSAEAAEALAFLQKIGFLKRNRSGRLIPAERNITTPREVLSLAVTQFHRQMIQKAIESLEKTPAKQRDISSLTVALSKEKFQEAKRRLQEFRRELNILLSEEKNPTSVYQINFQMFNLSEVPW